MSLPRIVVLALVLVVLLVVVTRPLRVATGSRAATAVGIAALGAAWMLVNGPVEGAVLLTVTRDHGLTVADLPSVALYLVAGLVARPRVRRPVRVVARA